MLADTIVARLVADTETSNEQQTSPTDVTPDKPAAIEEDVEMMDDNKPDDEDASTGNASAPAAATPASVAKAKGARRKSSGVPEHKGKKLNRKSSMAKITHTDAKPGDYFYVKLKGFPLWPAIICEEDMIPDVLKRARPVTTARSDGSYRADFEDGGNKVDQRSFPVMYLFTNELYVEVPSQHVVL